MRRALCWLVATFLSALVAPLAGASSEPDATESRYAVGVRLLPLEDTTRVTPADPEGQTPVMSSVTRALPTIVYYPAAGEPVPAPSDPARDAPVPDAPAAGGRFPLVLFSHGAPGTPADYASILERWAAEGYVVVAPTFPVTSLSGPTAVAEADQPDQVRDARFVLDHVLARNRTPAPEGGFDGRLDPKRIAVAGHSMGGLTTLALVSDCCRDRRITAAVVLAGVAENDPGPVVRHPSGPILFAHATLDIAVPIGHSQRAYRDATEPKYFLEVRLPVGGIAGHVLPYFVAGAGELSSAVAEVIDDFLAGYLDPDRSARRGITAVARSNRYLRLRAEV